MISCKVSVFTTDVFNIVSPFLKKAYKKNEPTIFTDYVKQQQGNPNSKLNFTASPETDEAAAKQAFKDFKTCVESKFNELEQTMGNINVYKGKFLNKIWSELGISASPVSPVTPKTLSPKRPFGY